jgi:hypothetical protein
LWKLDAERLFHGTNKRVHALDAGWEHGGISGIRVPRPIQRDDKLNRLDPLGGDQLGSGDRGVWRSYDRPYQRSKRGGILGDTMMLNAAIFLLIIAVLMLALWTNVNRDER